MSNLKVLTVWSMVLMSIVYYGFVIYAGITSMQKTNSTFEKLQQIQEQGDELQTK